jgi:hypothetical protein
MKKTKRKATRLTSKSTDEEVIRWTKSHDVFDRLKAGVSEVVEDHKDPAEVLREAIFQDNTTQLNMRLPPAMKAVLSKLARQRTTDATTLARIWLAERRNGNLKRDKSTNAQTVSNVCAADGFLNGGNIDETGQFTKHQIQDLTVCRGSIATSRLKSGAGN